MVHAAEMKAMQVGNVARDLKGEDLPRRSIGDLVPIQKPIEEEAALRRGVALPARCPVRLHMSGLTSAFRRAVGCLRSTARLCFRAVEQTWCRADRFA